MPAPTYPAAAQMSRAAVWIWRALLVGQERRRRLLDQLLVPALQRAVPGADDRDRAVLVGHDLRLDVPRLVQVALDEALAAAERRLRLAHRGREQLRDLLHRAGDLEPAPAAAERRLDRHRQAVLLGEREHLVRAGDRVGACRAPAARRPRRPGAGPRPCRRAPGSRPAAGRSRSARRRGRPGRSPRSRTGIRSRGAPRRRPTRRAASSTLSTTRYESAAVLPPSAYASSASRTCSASRSGSAYTATLRRPASRQARTTRTAISPRFAISTVRTATPHSLVPESRDRGAVEAPRDPSQPTPTRRNSLRSSGRDSPITVPGSPSTPRRTSRRDRRS